MKCPICGYEVQEGARFCNNCGEEIKTITEETIIESNETKQKITEKGSNILSTIINVIKKIINSIDHLIKSPALQSIKLYQVINILSYIELVIGIIFAITQSYTTSYWLGTTAFSFGLFMFYLIVFIALFIVLKVVAKHLENQAEIIKLLKELKK